MMDKSGHASPSPGKNFRRVALSASMTGPNGERALIIRRERLKLRRIKSLSLMKSSKLVAADGEISPGGEKCRKRKRNGFSTSKKASILRLSSAPLPPLDQLPENDVIIAGKSSLLSREGTRSVRCLSHGSVSLIGRRREMEDAVAVEPGFLQSGPKVYDFFGVYDGHGGSRVADACRVLLHKLVAKHVEEEGIDYGERKVIDWEKLMASSFRKMDEEVNKDGSAVAMTGSTAVVAVVGEDKLVVANCGDSRAVLSRDGVAVALSDDHKPDRPDELERIEVAGGKVINWNGQRVLGVLATSRSIGDQYLKPFVISEPEVKVINRTDKDEFLILACDGLWDVISNDVACQIIRKVLEGRVDGNILGEVADAGESGENAEGRAARAASLLAKLAIARGSRDNISVIVIELKRSGC